LILSQALLFCNATVINLLHNVSGITGFKAGLQASVSGSNARPGKGNINSIQMFCVCGMGWNDIFG
jgi:hypothetical protein